MDSSGCQIQSATEEGEDLEYGAQGCKLLLKQWFL